MGGFRRHGSAGCRRPSEVPRTGTRARSTNDDRSALISAVAQSGSRRCSGRPAPAAPRLTNAPYVPCWACCTMAIPAPIEWPSPIGTNESTAGRPMARLPFWSRASRVVHARWWAEARISGVTR